jgi:hypothetical protein
MKIEQEGWKLDWPLFGYIAGIVAVAALDVMLGKWGWYLMPVIAILTWLSARRVQKMQDPAREPIRIKSVKPVKDQYR